MALVRSDEDAINIALIDALHAFSNETGKAEAYHTPDTGQCHQDLSIPSIIAPPDLTQTREAVWLDVPSPQIINGTADEGNLYPDPTYVSHGHFSLIDTRSTFEINSKKKRPAYRYATLIAMAILQANNRCLPLARIYQWISHHFPFYSLAKSGWQNSVRHNLSVKEYFIKLERPSHDPGKGHYWGIKPGKEHQFTQDIGVDRSAKIVGNLRRRRDGSHRPSAKDERPAAPISTNSVVELYLNDNTMKTQSQRGGKPFRVTVETSGSIPEGRFPHPSVIPLTLTPPLCSQPRGEIDTSPLRKEAQVDHIKRESRLDADEGIDVCEYLPSNDKPVTHVYLPHLMRYVGPKRQQFEAHRAESEIARIRRSSTNRVRSTSRA
jgi:hypothetical protein